MADIYNTAISEDHESSDCSLTGVWCLLPGFKPECWVVRCSNHSTVPSPANSHARD